MDPMSVSKLQVDTPGRLKRTVEVSLNWLLRCRPLDFVAEQGHTLKAHAQNLTVEIWMLIHARVCLGHNFGREERQVGLLSRCKAVVVRDYGAATRFPSRVNRRPLAPNVNFAIARTPQGVKCIKI